LFIDYPYGRFIKCSAMSLNDERKVLMNKKILVMGIALIMLCTAAVVVFADASVSFTSNSVTVRNTEKGRIPKVEVCVTIEENSGRKVDVTWTFNNVGSSSQTRRADSGQKILGAYSTYCAVPVIDE